MMKVFTVGLDQKPPLEETKSEKSDSPPPGYSTTSSARIPLPMGPELPRPPLPPPAPIIVRKSRGYKGILLALLAVFLMAVFALTLSEMAYNRQREENFFKLRWAELKHHMGYDNEGPYGYYQSAASSVGEKFDRLLNLIRSNELAQQQQVDQQQASTISSTAVPLPSPEPVVAIDSFPMLPSRPSSASSSQQASSVEVEPPQPPAGMLGDANGPFGGQLRDARLQFLRNILQKIKQHAEDIGFDGTMQVSIIEVEPQNGAEGNGDNAAQTSAGNQQQQMMPWMAQRGPFPAQVLPQQFFPHPRPLIDELKNSRSFLDGFGEFHQPQPSFMQNNQVAEPEERPRPPMFGPWAQQPPHNELVQQSPQGNGPEFVDNLRWQRLPPLFRQPPEMMFFHPFFPPQQQQQQQPMMNNMNMRFPPPPPPPTSEWAQAPQQQMPAQQMPALPRPSAFDRWNGPQGPMMFPQPQQQQQQQQPLPFQLPQQQQIQIDFPEVKLPPPIIGDNNNNNNNEDMNNKFEPVPPSSSSSQQPPAEEQPKWLPKWAVDSDSQNSGQNQNDNQNQNDQDQNIGGAGPPAVQPPDMIKFPSVTVVEPAKNVADNEEVVQGQTQTDGTQAPPPAESEKKEQPEEVVEVDPPQPIVPQNDQQQPEIKTGQDQPAEQQQQQPQQQHPQFQKWFPEVPSVFFQVDDPNGNSGGDGALHLPKPNSDSSSEHSSSDSGDDSDGDEPQPPPKQQEQQQAQGVQHEQEHDDHHQPHLVVD